MFHLKPKPRPPDVRRLRDPIEAGRLFGDHGDPGEAIVDDAVQVLHELDRLEILLAAIGIGEPLPLLAGIIEIEHRGHRIDPQAVDMVLFQPEQGVGDQEADDLLAAVIEDEGAPFRVMALARVLVFVKAGAVKAAQAVAIGGKVRRHPVQDDANPVLVALVDKVHEIVRGAEAAAGEK